MKKSFALLFSALLALPSMQALASSSTAYSNQASTNHCDFCGRVKQIQPYETAGSGKGGMVVGAVVGGLLGNQIGGGSGKTLATVAGAAGGAYAGKKVAENHTTRTRWTITVKMDDGHIEKLDQGSSKNLHVGDYVKVRNGHASRY